jgi:hypothetical protein
MNIFLNGREQLLDDMIYFSNIKILIFTVTYY